MTDEKIVKALGCCSKDDCESCPLSNYDGCKSLLFDGDIVIDLIKRQQSDIESLEADYENVYKQASADILASIADGGTSCEWCIDKHRAEAVREFAERLTIIICDKIVKSIDNLNGYDYYITDVYTDIDNLVKEMTKKEGGKG